MVKELRGVISQLQNTKCENEMMAVDLIDAAAKILASTRKDSDL